MKIEHTAPQITALQIWDNNETRVRVIWQHTAATAMPERQVAQASLPNGISYH